jgi:hypothetical protein
LADHDLSVELKQRMKNRNRIQDELGLLIRGVSEAKSAAREKRHELDAAEKALRDCESEWLTGIDPLPIFAAAARRNAGKDPPAKPDAVVNGQPASLEELAGAIKAAVGESIFIDRPPEGWSELTARPVIDQLDAPGRAGRNVIVCRRKDCGAARHTRENRCRCGEIAFDSIQDVVAGTDFRSMTKRSPAPDVTESEQDGTPARTQVAPPMDRDEVDLVWERRLGAGEPKTGADHPRDEAGLRRAIETCEGSGGDGSETWICLRCGAAYPRGLNLAKCPWCQYGPRRTALGLLEEIAGAGKSAEACGEAWRALGLLEELAGTAPPPPPPKKPRKRKEAAGTAPPPPPPKKPRKRKEAAVE